MNRQLLRDWGRDIVRGIKFILFGPPIVLPQADRKERLGRLLDNRPVDSWKRGNGIPPGEDEVAHD